MFFVCDITLPTTARVVVTVLLPEIFYRALGSALSILFDFCLVLVHSLLALSARFFFDVRRDKSMRASDASFEFPT